MTTVTLRTGQVVNDADLYSNQHEVVFLPCVQEAILSAGDAITAAGQAQTALNNLVSASGANATSTTALTIGLGSQSLTVQAGKNFAVGHTLKIASTASPTNYMVGDVVSYNNSTGALVVNVTYFNGSGSASAWTVTIFAGSSTGGAGRNYALNGDCRIFRVTDSVSFSATDQHHVIDGFKFRHIAASGGSLSCSSLAFAGRTYAGAVAHASLTVTADVLLSQIISAADIAMLSGQALIISCLVYQNTGVTVNVGVDISTPTAMDNYTAETVLASNLGSMAVPSGTLTRLIATLPAGSVFTNGLKVTIDKASSVFDAGGVEFFGVTDLKVGLDSNFVANDADIIRALGRYERSYQDASVNGAVSDFGSKRAIVLSGGVNLVDATIIYKQKKRATPTVTIYSPNNGATANVAEYTPAGVFVANRAASVVNLSSQGFNLTITGGTAGNVVAFHWVADARL
jgi:hypothetical protein